MDRKIESTIEDAARERRAVLKLLAALPLAACTAGARTTGVGEGACGTPAGGGAAAVPGSFTVPASCAQFDPQTPVGKFVLTMVKNEQAREAFNTDFEADALWKNLTTTQKTTLLKMDPDLIAQLIVDEGGVDVSKKSALVTCISEMKSQPNWGVDCDAKKECPCEYEGRTPCDPATGKVESLKAAKREESEASGLWGAPKPGSYSIVPCRVPAGSNQPITVYGEGFLKDATVVLKRISGDQVPDIVLPIDQRGGTFMCSTLTGKFPAPGSVSSETRYEAVVISGGVPMIERSAHIAVY